MYINEAIRRADALSPNEYTQSEKYAWIDELNATLMQEHLHKYASVDLDPQEDGTYLLPEGITFEMVDKIIAQGRSIEKYDFRSFGIAPMYTPRERFFVPVHCQAGGMITVIYLVQYEPIRTARAAATLKTISTFDFGEYNVSAGTTENTIAYYTGGTPRVGDMVKFSVSADCSEVALPFSPSTYTSPDPKIEIEYDFKTGVTYYAEYTQVYTYETSTGPTTHYTVTANGKGSVATSEETVYAITSSSDFQAGDTVNVTYGENETKLDITKVEASGTSYKLHFAGELSISADTQCTIERIVTEETLTPAPYDQMYIDWIMAKIAFYQRNYTVYNQIMNKFYDTLRRFDNWYIQRAPMDKDNKIRNWMR